MSDCVCQACVNCCHQTPGWPTPDEARKLIDAGHADRLMLDWWEDEPNVHLLCPASDGYEGDWAPEMPDMGMGGFFLAVNWTKGRCVFLDGKDRCEVHEVAKPHECVITDHDTTQQVIADARDEIVAAWREATDLVAEWCDLVGCTAP